VKIAFSVSDRLLVLAGRELAWSSILSISRCVSHLSRRVLRARRYVTWSKRVFRCRIVNHNAVDPWESRIHNPKEEKKEENVETEARHLDRIFTLSAHATRSAELSSVPASMTRHD